LRFFAKIFAHFAVVHPEQCHAELVEALSKDYRKGR